MTIKLDSKIGIRNEWQHLDSAENTVDFIAYLERVEASSHLQLYHESLLRGLHVNDGDCLLDLASGIGTISRILRASFSNADLIVGIDLSLTMARHAQTIAEKVFRGSMSLVAMSLHFPFQRRFSTVLFPVVY
jgi:cyclopropane fatty-acyl-phospholipid synthase-like methyltransferase